MKHPSKADWTSSEHSNIKDRLDELITCNIKCFVSSYVKIQTNLMGAYVCMYDLGMCILCKQEQVALQEQKEAFFLQEIANYDKPGS